MTVEQPCYCRTVPLTCKESKLLQIAVTLLEVSSALTEAIKEGAPISDEDYNEMKNRLNWYKGVIASYYHA